jgi:type IV secretory pathway protease TraF
MTQNSNISKVMFVIFFVIQLKARYGQAYKIVITTPPKYEEKARKYLFKLIPTVKVINTLAGTTKYEVSLISF